MPSCSSLLFYCITGYVTITNNGATILKLLEVEHPAATVLCELQDKEDVTVINDGAIILKLLEVEHPAATVLCELQDKEVGDGTSSGQGGRRWDLICETLKSADELVKQKSHPTSVISGYRLACKEAVCYINENHYRNR
ncbi:T-complex protein 1 subunit alpha [Liparis tanakae]|uniref:T-complex protein 1 subunit alpha n=1 Tax=Liparis tanakae TaxID=230148 RepID=A0A4Z2HF28_9TELE|nr:T-complex protein 1 subunit alpha [Liparis tanakae]